MQPAPFIHLLQTPYGKYVFDVNTDSINFIDDKLYSALSLLQKGECDKIPKKMLIEIDNMRNNGLLKSNKPKVMKHPVTNNLEYYLTHRVEGITLQVTQECNFRCRYCPYSQNNSVTRKHMNKKMSLETAKKGIDFLQTRCRDTERVSVGFYGGEPLLEFDLIEKIIRYARKKLNGKAIWFNMTTNCSLLNLNMLKFLVENDLHITISIDGPKDIHDNNRKFASNNCGTFDAVIKKIAIIEREYPEYLKNNVSFNVVLDPSKEFNCINQMFLNYDIFKNSSMVQSSVIDDTFSDAKNVYSKKYIEEFSYESFLIFASYLGWLQKENLSAASLQKLVHYDHLKKVLGSRTITEEMSHGGPCIIGARKLFMDYKGGFFPCERVNEASCVMQIGTVEEGFDIKKIDTLLNACKLTESKCKNCWAINHCTICAGQIDDGKQLSVEKKLALCEKQREKAEYTLQEYIAIKEIKAGGYL